MEWIIPATESSKCEGPDSNRRTPTGQRPKRCAFGLARQPAHALKRVCLSHYASVDPAAWHFSSNLHGRPEIAAPDNTQLIRFNISHTTGLVTCAVTLRNDVGVDVEYTRRDMSFGEVVRRQFAPAEGAALRSLPVELQHERFFDFWTLKEAYIKAVGEGLSIPLDAFSFSLNADHSVHLRRVSDPQDESKEWQFMVYSPTDHHRLSLAVRGGDGAQLFVQIRHVLPLVIDPASIAPDVQLLLTGGRRIPDLSAASSSGCQNTSWSAGSAEHVVPEVRRE